MLWRVIYHHEVYEDLKALGQAEARTVLKAVRSPAAGASAPATPASCTG